MLSVTKVRIEEKRWSAMSHAYDDMNDGSKEQDMTNPQIQDNKGDKPQPDDGHKPPFRGVGYEMNFNASDAGTDAYADGGEALHGSDAHAGDEDSQTFGNWYRSQSSQADDAHANMGASEGTYPYRVPSQQGTEPATAQFDTIRSSGASPVPPAGYAASSESEDHATEGDSKGMRAKETKKGKGHAPWLVGGLAAGALVAGLGVFAVTSIPSGGIVAPPHDTEQWDGAPSDDKGTSMADNVDSASDGGTSSKSGDVTLSRDVANKCLPSVVAIHVSDGMSAGMGSGVIVDEKGHVLTNSHVVKDMKEIIVVSGSGEEYKAKVLGLDDSSDLAVLDVEWGEAKVVPMEYGDSSALMVGDWVMTIGSPFGLDQSASTGIVSALSRNQMMESYGGYRIYANLIQTDAAINVGNSGGALVDSDGKLVGINSMLASNSGSYAAVGFAIPSNYAKRVADQIIEGKEVEHAYIGAQFGSVSMVATRQDNSHGTIIDESGNTVSPDDGTPNTGAYVAGVVDDSPAKEAGLQEGDIVTKFGDEKINSASGIIMEIRSHEIGEKVPVTVWRDNKEVTLEVTLGTDKGKGLYDNDGNSQQGHQQQQQSPFGQSPYGGSDNSWEFFERMMEQLGME